MSGFRDQFTPKQEAEMEAAQAWSEENEIECPWCGGTGEGDFVPGASVKPPCGQCNGRGLVAIERCDVQGCPGYRPGHSTPCGCGNAYCPVGINRG